MGFCKAVAFNAQEAATEVRESTEQSISSGEHRDYCQTALETETKHISSQVFTGQHLTEHKVRKVGILS